MRTPLSARLDDPSPGSNLRIGRASRADRIEPPHRLVLVLTLVSAFVLVAALPAEAGRDSGSLSLEMIDPADTIPNWADQVTFDVTTTAKNPYVNVRCYQGEAFVYDGWAGFFDGAWFGQTFTLSSSYWTSGDADCKARLVRFARNGQERVLARLPFHVYA